MNLMAKIVVQKRSLGQSGIQVSPVGLGVMEFAGGGGFLGFLFPVIAQDVKNEIVRTALEGGINWFDTAEMYGLGVSERSLATALQAAGKSDHEVVIATKWRPLLRTAGNIRRTIDDRLKHLAGYPIDLYMVHQPWSFSSPEAEMDAMAELVQAGKIRSVGVSNFSPNRMRRAHAALHKHGLTLAVNQVHYSLLHRQIERDGTLETAQELGMTIIAYTPLALGLLSGKYHKNPELLNGWGYSKLLSRLKFEASRPVVNVLEQVAEKYSVTPAQVALNWVIHFCGETVVTIPGATKVYQAREAAGAMQFQLAEEDLARLDEVSRPFLRGGRGQ